MGITIELSERDFIMELTKNHSAILKDSCTMTEAFENFKRRCAALPSPFESAQKIRETFPEIADAVLKDGADSFSGLALLPGNGAKTQIGNPPRWHEDPYHNNEYVFQISRMNHWLPMLYTYFLTGNEDYAKKILDEMMNWIDVCPRGPITDEAGNWAYEQYNCPAAKEWRLLECGIRPYRTWCPSLEGLAASPHMTEEIFAKALHSLHEQCETLYHLSPLAWPKADHNHYLMENLGLLCTACMFPELVESETWKNHSIKELCRCMEAQVDEQGAQIEGCPSYHNGCVFWFAMVMVYSRKYGFELPSSYIERFEKMPLYSLYATRPNGVNVPWGDTGTVTGTAVKAAVCACMGTGNTGWLSLFRTYFSYQDLLTEAEEQIWRMDDIGGFCDALIQLKERSEKPSLPLLYYNKVLNHAYFRSSWDTDARSVQFACRCPIQNLHAHIDPCGFDFTAYGIPMAVDPGRYTYKNGEDRKNFKTMKWHNTLTINHQDAWEYIHSWAYGPQKPGRILDCGEKPGLIWAIAAHRNYEPAIHTRLLALVEGTFLLVADLIEGLSGTDSLQLQFHIDRPAITLKGTSALAQWETGQSLSITTTAETPVLLPGKVSDRSDVYRDSVIVQYQKNKCRSTETLASILYPAKEGPAPRVEKLSAELFEENQIKKSRITFQILERNYEFILEGGRP